MENLDISCHGCGRVEPMGIHYIECTLKTPGDLIAERDTENIVAIVLGPDETLTPAA